MFPNRQRCFLSSVGDSDKLGGSCLLTVVPFSLSALYGLESVLDYGTAP